MLDQNTTTVLTTAITVIGTLGGAIVGVVLSNRYVARHEKAKRNEEKIEEIYTLLLQVHKWVEDAFSDLGKVMNKKDHRYDLKSYDYGKIEPAVDRLTTLVRLYIHEIVPDIQIFVGIFSALRNNYDARARSDFEVSYMEVLTSLEKLVR